MRLIVSKQQDGNLKPNHMYNHTKVKSKLAITKLSVLRNFALIKTYWGLQRAFIHVGDIYIKKEHIIYK